MEVKISDWREITIKEVVTRKISREYQETLLNWVNVENVDWKILIPSIPVINTSKAKDNLVKNMTWLSDQEIDSLPDKDYNLLLSKCEEYFPSLEQDIAKQDKEIN